MIYNEQKKKDPRITATEMLLDHFDMIEWRLQCYSPQTLKEIAYSFNKEDDVSEFSSKSKLVIENWSSCNLTDFIISSAILDRLKDTVLDLRTYLNHGELLSNLIFDKYISKKYPTVEDLCEKYDISKSTYKRYKNEAIEIIARRFWGPSEEDLENMAKALSYFAKIHIKEQ